MQPLNPKDVALTQTARAALSTRPGQALLTWILEDCGTFDPSPVTPEAVVLRNWSMRLLTILGGGGLDRENVQAFTMRLMKQPLIIQKQEED